MNPSTKSRYSLPFILGIVREYATAKTSELVHNLLVKIKSPNVVISGHKKTSYSGVQDGVTMIVLQWILVTCHRQRKLKCLKLHQRNIYIYIFIMIEVNIEENCLKYFQFIGYEMHIYYKF